MEKGNESLLRMSSIEMVERIDIKLGYSCNNNCRFCVLGRGRGRNRDRTTSECKRELEIAKGKSAKKVLLTGGEPTIRKDIFEVVSYAKKLGFREIHIESNGRMFSYPEIAERMIEAGANSFSISLHAHSPELYAYLTRTTEHAFHQAIEGIKNVRSHCKNVSLNSIITKPNYIFLSEIIKIAKNTGIRGINYPFVNPYGSAWDHREEMVPDIMDVVPYLHKAINLAESNKIFVTTEMIPLCLMKGYEEHLVEPTLPDIEIFSLVHRENFRQAKKLSRVKDDACKPCRKYLICEGISKHYTDFRGFPRLSPIK